MNDLTLAYIVMLLVTLIAGVSAATWLVSPRHKTMILLVTFALIAMFAYMTKIAGQLYLARWFPHSAAIVWTNLTPILVALAAGWILRLPNIPVARRRWLSVGLAIGAVASLFWPTMGAWLRPVRLGAESMRPSEPSSGIVMQSSWATCSPAAAATLLTQAGIPTTEADMIPLCLTDSSGTPSLGLYRGLKIRAAQSGAEVNFVQMDVDTLMSNVEWPILITVELPAYGVEDPRYENHWGWIPGMGHSVVALGISGDQIVVADPAIGQELWTRKDLQILWTGYGLRVLPHARSYRRQTVVL